LAEIERDGLKIHYATFGEKASSSAVVFLPGAGSDGTLFDAQIGALKEKRCVIAVDHRGFGKSDMPSGPCTADQLSDDVMAIIDAESLDRIALVGYSLGGLVAQRLVSRYPDRAEKLVLMNCSLGAGNPDTVLPRREVINMFLYAGALTREDVCKNAADYSFGTSFEKDDPKGYKAFYNYTLKNSEAIPLHIPMLVSDQALIEDYSAVRIPVMVILSTDDPVTPPANGEAFKKHLPHARIEYLDGHHASMLIHPREVSALLADFLA
jgi:pimeloyl-ACP methyl ester carboxylesterase